MTNETPSAGKQTAEQIYDGNRPLFQDLGTKTMCLAFMQQFADQETAALKAERDRLATRVKELESQRGTPHKIEEQGIYPVAIQWEGTGESFEAIKNLGISWKPVSMGGKIFSVLAGDQYVVVSPGDWVIRLPLKAGQKIPGTYNGWYEKADPPDFLVAWNGEQTADPNHAPTRADDAFFNWLLRNCTGTLFYGPLEKTLSELREIFEQSIQNNPT